MIEIKNITKIYNKRRKLRFVPLMTIRFLLKRVNLLLFRGLAVAVRLPYCCRSEDCSVLMRGVLSSMAMLCMICLLKSVLYFGLRPWDLSFSSII